VAHPARADAVVVLGGDDYRARFDLGWKLAREGAAPFLLVSTTPAYVGVNRCLSVTGVRVICFFPRPVTTRGEAHEVAALARRYGLRSVIIVATRFQTARARLRFRRCLAGPVGVEDVSPALWRWPYDLAYEWAATAKALFVQRSC
jgi:uncharacterized SAM-binding protein YcdF (DUF218 family)